MTTTINAQEIASALNASGYTYYGANARGWTSDTESRIYFGADYVRIVNGQATNAKAGKARAQTIGDSAVEAVAKIIAAHA